VEERSAHHGGIRGGAAAVAASPPERGDVKPGIAVARLGPAPAAAPADAVEALRARLTSRAAGEHAVLGFLSDDLREAQAALSCVAAYLSDIEAALADAAPSQERMLGLALGGGAMAGVDRLGGLLGRVRRRLAQVAARM